MTPPEESPEVEVWRARLVSAAIVAGVATLLVLIAALTTAIDAKPPVNRFGAPLRVFDVTDRMRIWASGIAGTPTLLALLAAVAASIASPRPGPGRPSGTALALGVAGGCAVLFAVVLGYDLAVGPSDAGRTVGHALGRLASIIMSGSAAWWALGALRPDESVRSAPPITADEP